MNNLPCNFCDAPATLACLRCYDSYCSVQCQRLDWQKHRMFCFEMPKLVKRPVALTRCASLSFHTSLSAENHGVEVCNQSQMANFEETPTKTSLSARLQKMKTTPVMSDNTQQMVGDGKIPESTQTSIKIPQLNKLKHTGIIANYIKNGMDRFKAKLGYILNKYWLTAEMKLSSTFDQLPKLMENAIQDVETFDTTSKLKKGMVIAYEICQKKWVRSVVIDVDEKTQAAIIYLCDNGYFETLNPIPKKLYLLPENVAHIPNLAIFVRIDEILDNDLDSFYKTYLNREEPLEYVLQDMKSQEKTYQADVIFKNKPIANVTLFDEDPSLKDFGLKYWSIQSRPNTTVLVQSAHLNSQVHAIIHPAEKRGVFNALLNDAFERSSKYTNLPKLNSLVLYKACKDKVLRCLVLRCQSKSTVEIRDLDSSNMMLAQLNELRTASDFICNLPVYTMDTILSDFNDCNRAQIKLIQQFFDQEHLKKREFILKYTGLPAKGIVLLINSSGDSLYKKCEEFIAKIEVKQRQEEEEKRKRLQKQEEEKLKRLEQEKKQRQEEEEKRKRFEKQEKVKRLEQEAKQREEEEEKRIQLQKQEDEAKLKRLEKETSKFVTKRIMYNDLDLIPLPIGNVCDLVILDKDDKAQTLGVMERKLANLDAFAQISDTIEAYIESIKVTDFAEYVPEMEEIVLGYNDEKCQWQRACVLRMQKTGVADVQYIDFGNITTAKLIIPMPEHLKEPTPRVHIATTDLSPEKFDKIQPLKFYKFKVASCAEGLCELEEA